MEIIIRAEAKEIAALVIGLQERQKEELRDPLDGLTHREELLQRHSKPEECS